MTANLRTMVRDVADYPQPGILFRDITPLLRDAVGLQDAIDALAAPWSPGDVDYVAGIEARGFVLAPTVALRLQAGFLPVRKAGKLPCAVTRQEYDLEYGSAAIELHRDALEQGDRVVIVDDVLATGGTARAAVRLVESLGATVVGLEFLVELTALDGRRGLDPRRGNSDFCR